MPFRSACCPFAILSLGLILSGPAKAADGSDGAPQSLAPLDVISTTPLPGSQIPKDRVPANIQGVGNAELEEQHPNSVSDALNQNLSSVSVNDTEGNPFQPDVSFRGFTASPVLGTPQGLSVFLDGVRVNEVFGDTVNWDLIPPSAIARIDLIPGSNPLFGLNTLGGALAITSKNGSLFPGTSLETAGGSFGQHSVEFQSGDHKGAFDYFVTANGFDQTGWAEHSASRVRSLFARAGYAADGSSLDLTLSSAQTDLAGSQTLPASFLNDPRQAYTWPDTQNNRMTFVNLAGTHDLSDVFQLGGNLYHREVSTGIFNSNVNNDFDTSLPVGPGNEPTGNVIDNIMQDRYGASLQLSAHHAWAKMSNDFALGVAYDRGQTGLAQLQQEAGSSRDTSSNQALILGTDLDSTATDAAWYATDTFGLSEKTFITLSARHDQARVELNDLLGTALDGKHSFGRINPSAGLTYLPLKNLTTYVNYNEGMRVPTPVELTCADPNAPCSLPNAFSADPALSPVVSKTWEAGARGRGDARLNWSFAVFRTTLNDDIQFVSSGGGATSSGFFDNVGQTRRQGFEGSLSRKLGAFILSADFSQTDATFQTPLILSSPSNSQASSINCTGCSQIQVRPGDRIPGIPRDLLKVRLEYLPSARLSIGLSILGQSSQFARGDENNADTHGTLAGYALINMDASYQIDGHWRLFATIDNLLDRRYSSFAVLGENEFTGPGNTFDPTGRTWRSEQFSSVGAPFGAWIGLEYRFGPMTHAS